METPRCVRDQAQLSRMTEEEEEAQMRGLNLFKDENMVVINPGLGGPDRKARQSGTETSLDARKKKKTGKLV